MANKQAFMMAEKQLLIKLHKVAMDNLSLDENEYVLINSGFAVNGKIDTKKTDYSDQLDEDPSKIKLFGNKTNMYEVGIVVTNKGIKNFVSGFSGIKAEGTPEDLYNVVKKKYNSDEVDQVKDAAYKYLIDYMTSFCGNKYAKSIPKEKVVCMAFPNIDYIQKSKNGIIGDCDTKCKQASILLYKIGYTVGKSK